jgi:hypothetical protein
VQWSEKWPVFGRHVEPVKSRKKTCFWAWHFLHRTFFSDPFVLFSEFDKSEKNAICFIFWRGNVTFFGPVNGLLNGKLKLKLKLERDILVRVWFA